MLSLTLEHTQNRNRERTSLAPVLDLTPSYSLKNTQQNTHTAARVNSVNTLAINSNSQYIQIYILLQNKVLVLVVAHLAALLELRTQSNTLL